MKKISLILFFTLFIVGCTSETVTPIDVKTTTETMVTVEAKNVFSGARAVGKASSVAEKATAEPVTSKNITSYTIKNVNIRDSGLVVYSVTIEANDENELMDTARVIAEDKSINTLSRIYFYKPNDEYAFCFIEIPEKDAKDYIFTRLIE